MIVKSGLIIIVDMMKRLGSLKTLNFETKSHSHVKKQEQRRFCSKQVFSLLLQKL